MPQRMLGDYEILSEAGAGGMGVVYRALQRSLGRLVALKVIRGSISTDPGYRERFLREAQLVASVDHPHVVSIFEVGEYDDALFLAMQWVEGLDLTRLLETSGRLQPARAATIGVQVARALDAVHELAGLVHRDVKPANILVRKLGGEDHAYLTDFGIARPAHGISHLTRPGAVVGTAGYLAPEQIMGGEPGPQSDLYALACVLFETLTGQPPFIADNELGLRWAHAREPRPRATALVPELGSAYDDFFQVALAVDPSARFGSGRAFANALASTQAASGPHAPTQFAPTPPAAPLPTASAPMLPPPPLVYAAPPPAKGGESPVLPVLIVVALLIVIGVAIAALVLAGAFSGGGGSAHLISQ